MVNAYRCIAFGILALLAMASMAQDIHFSIYEMSPLTLNPANTGDMTCDRRFANIYRNQWKAIGKPLQSYAASYDQRLYFLPGEVSAGLVLVNDQSGGIDLTENKLLLSASAKLRRGTNLLAAGAQIGLCTKVLSLNDAAFPEQYNRNIGQFDLGLFNGESNYGLKRSYWDMNVGITLTHSTSKGLLKFGTAVFHLNQPDDSFFRNGNGLRQRYVFHGQLQHQFNEKFFIRPSLLIMTLSKAQDAVLNAVAGIVLPTNELGAKKAWFGLALRSGISRNGDAAIPLVGFDFNFFTAAIAYDINFSELQVATNNRGALELSLIYYSRNTAIQERMIPCDRF